MTTQNLPAPTLPKEIPQTDALGEGGEYWRPAQIIGELPFNMRGDAMRHAERVFDVSNIRFGQPIYMTLGMTSKETEIDGREWLRCRGCELPLALFWQRPVPN